MGQTLLDAWMIVSDTLVRSGDAFYIVTMLARHLTFEPSTTPFDPFLSTGLALRAARAKRARLRAKVRRAGAQAK